MRSLAEQFDAFLFDLDGVVYIGDEPMSDAVEALGRLRAMGKAVRFLTNDPRYTRQQFVRRLEGMGIEAVPDEVIGCGWATAQHLRQLGVRSALVVGNAALASELEAAGIVPTEADGGEPPTVDAVVVGAGEHLGYRHILQASRAILAGANFVATNADGRFPAPGGPAPGTGAIVRAVDVATGRRPLVVGKPNPFMFRMALESLAPGAQAVMVGDNPATDILGAHLAGLPGILVAREGEGGRPGITVPQAQGASSRRGLLQADAVVSTLLALFEPSPPLRHWAPLPHPWPERVSPGVAAVVLGPEDRVLWVRRQDNGRWSLPSGHVEPAESLHEAVRREVLEETGLVVRPVRLTGVYSEPAAQVFVYPSGEAVHFVTCCFLCRVEGGSLQPAPDEVSEAAFFEPGAPPPAAMAIHLQWVAHALAGGPEAVVR